MKKLNSWHDEDETTNVKMLPGEAGKHPPNRCGILKITCKAKPCWMLRCKIPA